MVIVTCEKQGESQYLDWIICSCIIGIFIVMCFRKIFNALNTNGVLTRCL